MEIIRLVVAIYGMLDYFAVTIDIGMRCIFCYFIFIFCFGVFVF